MLTIIGSLASLLGLSIQVYKEFSEKHPSDLGQYMGLLVTVTDTAQSWKYIHHQYQSISSDLEAVRRNLFRSKGLNLQARAVADIAPNTLRNIFESGTLQNAVHYFSDDLEPAFKPLRKAASLGDSEQNQLLQDVQKFGRNDLTNCVGNILAVQSQTVSIHDEFCVYLQQVNEYLQEESWGQREVDYLVKNRAVIRTKFDKNIINADTALINFLDIVKIVVDQVRDKDT